MRYVHRIEGDEMKEINLKEMKLKPCPFCSGQAQFIFISKKIPAPWFVECTNEWCKAKTKGYKNTTEAQEAWNLRLETDLKETEFILTDHDYDDQEFTCKNCRQIFLFDKDFIPDYKFCPLCGCKITKYINPEEEDNDEKE